MYALHLCTVLFVCTVFLYFIMSVLYFCTAYSIKYVYCMYVLYVFLLHDIHMYCMIYVLYDVCTIYSGEHDLIKLKAVNICNCTS